MPENYLAQHLGGVGIYCYAARHYAFSGLMSIVNIAGGVLALYGYLFPLPIYGDVSNQLAEIVNDVSSLFS